MAKKFIGFKPETMEKKILPALGYQGAMDQKSINAFLASSPSAAAKMGKYTMAARQMVEGRPVNAVLGGLFGGPKFGTPEYKALTQQTHQRALDQQRFDKTMREGSIGDRVAIAKEFGINPTNVIRQQPDRSGGGGGSAAAQSASGGQVVPMPVIPGTTSGGTSGGGTGAGVNAMPSGAALTQQAGTNPGSMVSRASVVAQDGGPNALIAQNAGQAPAASQAAVTTAGQAATAPAPTVTPAAQMTAAQSTPALTQAMQGMQGEQGQLSAESIMDAAQMDPNSAASLQLEAAQLGQAQTVQAPAPLAVTQAQLVDGTAVKNSQVDSTLAKAEAALVQDEMADLMQDFQGGNTPVWAAGAMRAANAAMAARGLSASSMAGMAITQAAMEAALPIAQMDANNKQEMALMKAEQRAKFMGMEFDQNFQSKVINAARISEIANMNFSAEQTIALENARMAQTVDLANLNNRQAKVMADAATMTQIDMANLNNRQQANVQNAQAFLAMDMQNLDNAQQMTMFKARETANSILSDTAAENASRQFNAASQNQTDQFFANLGAQVNQFNAEQQNAIRRFNAGETNALAQFNAAQENAREQFNAQNHLVIAQANAQWAQNITTAANAAANQANRDAALAANNLTTTAYNNAIQRERDLLAWAWQSGENQADRDNALAKAKIEATGEGGNLIENAAGDFVSELVSAGTKIILGNILDFNPFAGLGT
tara:strand:+ start:75 stop:2222 length:2148 start_codon:yes stop_codon:yes gene_type:complete